MRFFIGDDNGFIKSLRVHPGTTTTAENVSAFEPSVLFKPSAEAAKTSSVNRLAIQKQSKGDSQ